MFIQPLAFLLVLTGVAIDITNYLGTCPLETGLGLVVHYAKASNDKGFQLLVASIILNGYLKKNLYLIYVAILKSF